MSKKVIVIGAGFAGLSAAACLAKEGYEVHILEKNEQTGGRARQFEAEGFTFDMGPSWYWMPDVFENFFALFGKKPSDYYDLVRLNPSYSVFFGEDDVTDIPANLSELYELFESLEKGSSEKLKAFLADAAYKYEVGINDLVHRPSRSVSEFIDMRLLKGLIKLDLLNSFHSFVRKYFKHEKLLKIMEFPILFLGATPQKTPALYSLMNYADISLGTWYPMGGMHKIIEAMTALVKELGVKIHLNTAVERVVVSQNEVKYVVANGQGFECDILVGGADYHHIEQHLLPENARTYTPKYWDKRSLAPSCLLFYIGVNKKLKNLQHHNLFFDEDFDIHANEIYTNPQWPSKPLFYVCCPSKTDSSVAPQNMENLFLLMPVAPDLEDNEKIRSIYFDLIMNKLEKLTKQDIRSHIVYKRSYAQKNFITDYNAFKGNAYGLANTLKQTALLKPSIKSKKISNLYYTGQLTVPGPGVPPSLISGQVVAKEICKEFKINHKHIKQKLEYEATI